MIEQPHRCALFCPTLRTCFFPDVPPPHSPPHPHPLIPPPYPVPSRNTEPRTRRNPSAPGNTSRSNSPESRPRPGPGPARTPPSPSPRGGRLLALPSRPVAPPPAACSASRATPFKTPSAGSTSAGSRRRDRQKTAPMDRRSGAGGARGGRSTRACRRTPWRPRLAAAVAAGAATTIARRAARRRRRVGAARTGRLPFASARARSPRGGREIDRLSRWGVGRMRACFSLVNRGELLLSAFDETRRPPPFRRANRGWCAAVSIFSRRLCRYSPLCRFAAATSSAHRTNHPFSKRPPPRPPLSSNFTSSPCGCRSRSHRCHHRRCRAAPPR